MEPLATRRDEARVFPAIVDALSRTSVPPTSSSWFATLKNELVYTRPWPTIAGLRAATFEFIEGWYHTRRLHSSLGYRGPAEYEATIQVAVEADLRESQSTSGRMSHTARR